MKAVRELPLAGETRAETPAVLPNIYQRIRQVMQKIAYVRKDANVDNQYKAVSHDMVTALVRPHLVDAGIVVSPKVISAQMIDSGRKSKSGNTAWRYEGRFQIDFVNVDDPADRITIELDAHADDYGDKAPGKALSYATKGAVLKLLMLETGENDEGRLTKDEDMSEAEEAKLIELRDAALQGTKQLTLAWQSAGKPLRLALAFHLKALQEAAAIADKQPEGSNAA